MILGENQVRKKTLMLWQLFAKACVKGKKMLVLDQVTVQCDVLICGLLVYVNRGNLYVTINFACMISFDGHLRN